MILKVIVAIILILFAYQILSISIYIIKKGGKDARDMIGCWALPLGVMLICGVVAFCGHVEKRNERSENNEISQAEVSKTRKNNTAKNYYSSECSFRFGVNYDDAKRIIKEQGGDVHMEMDYGFISDKSFSVFTANSAIDGVFIYGINFYFKENKLYGLQAEVKEWQNAKKCLTDRFGEPYKLFNKFIWVVDAERGMYYVSLYIDVVVGEDEEQTSEREIIECVKIR